MTKILNNLRDRSLFISGGEGGAKDFGGGDYMIFRKTRGGSVVTENPKGGIAENFGRIQKGASRKSSNVIRGDHFSEVTFKGGIG